MKYRVHIYAVVRVPVEIEEASSQREAIKCALEACDLHTLFQHPEYEYAEEITGYLVDENGDSEYENSRWYTKSGNPVRFRRKAAA